MEVSKMYAVCTYYIPKQPNVCEVHITVTPNQDLPLQVVHRRALASGPAGRVLAGPVFESYILVNCAFADVFDVNCAFAYASDGAYESRAFVLDRETAACARSI